MAVNEKKIMGQDKYIPNKPSHNEEGRAITMMEQPFPW
jgi:hypothetical protein